MGCVTKSEDGSKYKVLASTSAVDRQGDSIDQRGWDLKNFLKNPVMPWAHKYDELPLAKVTHIEVTDKGLEAEFEFAPVEGNPKAQQVKTLYDQGYLNAVSVGFIPKERNGKTITKAELLEISIVPVPANQEALRLALKTLDISEIPEIKGAVSDELNAEQSYEAKYEKWCEASEIISAFCSVYFAEETPVESFSALLKETIGLLQVVADNNGMEDDTEEDGNMATVESAIGEDANKKFIDFIEAKSGRTLSKKTLENIDKAIEAMKSASTVLEDLKSSSQDGDGNGDSTVDGGETKGEEAVDEKVMKLSLEDARQLRQSLVANDKSNELSLSIVNAHLRAMGVK